MPNPLSIYASDLSLWKCSRALYYCATERNKKPAYDDKTLKRFDYYASLETVAIHQMQQDGWNVIKPSNIKPGYRVPKDDQELYIYKDQDGNDIVRGRVDLVAAMQGREEAGLYEIKTANHHIYESVNSIQDFITSRYFWLPGQLAQWCMYMYMSGKNYGGLVQVDRDSFRIDNGNMMIDAKVHHCSILKGHDFYNEQVDEFAHLVMENIDTAWSGALIGLEPDFCNDLSVCSNCWCNRVVCFPPIEGAGVDVGFIGTHSPDDISRMLELEPLAREYNGLKKKFEDPLKVCVKDHGAPEQGWIVGEGKYLAKAKISKRTNYKVPKEIKEQYAEDSYAVSITVESLEGDIKSDSQD